MNDEPKILLLEDDPARIAWFRQAALHAGTPMLEAVTAADGLKLLREHTFTQIFLDHDLADAHYRVYDGVTYDDSIEEETGMALAKYLAENPDASPNAEIVIHSFNEPAAKEMARHLHKARRRYRIATFGVLQASVKL